jgi:diguanylate cyclase (GGDEF)-like protein
MPGISASTPPGDDPLKLLPKMRLFAGVRLDGFAETRALGHFERYGTGDILLRPDEPNSEIFVLVEGTLAVQSDLQSQPIAVLQPGECVGEMSVFEGELPSAYVVATAPGRVFRLHKEVVWRLIDHSNRFARNLLHILATRIRSGNHALAVTHERLVMQEISASLDPLTGIYNRRWLNAMFRRGIERARMDGTPLYCLMIDIDHFKDYNDTHGHLAGDQCLRAVAATLRDHLRPGDLLARFGGEEFSVLLDCGSTADSLAAAERLRAAVAQRHIVNRDGTPLPSVTVSIGVACAGDGDALEHVLERADRALYQAKRRGRDRVELAGADGGGAGSSRRSTAR